MSRMASPRLLQLFLIDLLIGLPLLFSSGAAQADGPTVQFVGIQRGCERDDQLDRAVERRLMQKGTPVALLHQSSGAPLPPCFGEHCAERFKQSCPTTGGRLLGGLVVQGKDMLQVRLWLHDLLTGQTAYQDEYCQSCEIVGAVATQAARLISAPHFGAAPSAVPLYCTQSGASGGATTANAAAGPLFLTVQGDGKNKSFLLNALKQQLSLLGYKPQPVTVEAKTATLDVLQKIVAGHKNARVFGVDVPKDGKLQLFLFDQKTELTEGKLIDCPECEKDRDALIARVQPEIPALLEHCFAESCSNANPSSAPPPAEACSPFPDPICGGDAGPASSAALSSGRHIDPATAKLVKGALWGIFAGSAAAAIGLAAANSTSAGTYVSGGHEHYNVLAQPAWALTGVAIVSLGLAIPTTILVNRAQRATTDARSPAASAASLIQCPN